MDERLHFQAENTKMERSSEITSSARNKREDESLNCTVHMIYETTSPDEKDGRRDCEESIRK